MVQELKDAIKEERFCGINGGCAVVNKSTFLLSYLRCFHDVQSERMATSWWLGWNKGHQELSIQAEDQKGVSKIPHVSESAVKREVGKGL